MENKTEQLFNALHMLKNIDEAERQIKKKWLKNQLNTVNR